MAVEIKKIGVIGAGQMGSGIAHVCALAGYEVGLSDI
jgi:3-hydroxybutyryl-CoA dehydrogenase